MGGEATLMAYLRAGENPLDAYVFSNGEYLSFYWDDKGMYIKEDVMNMFLYKLSLREKEMAERIAKGEALYNGIQ